MISMKRPSRGDRPSATTTRYVGCFFLPTRMRRIFTATEGVPSRLGVRGAMQGTPQSAKGQATRPVTGPASAGLRDTDPMDPQDLGPLTYDVDGPVARITLNDP